MIWNGKGTENTFKVNRCSENFTNNLDKKLLEEVQTTTEIVEAEPSILAGMETKDTLTPKKCGSR